MSESEHSSAAPMRLCLVGLAALQSSYSISLEGKDSLPLCRSEDGTYDMAVTVLLLVHVVREMCRVPDHHVLVANTLPVVEAAYVGGGVLLGCSRLARGGGYPVVDLAIVEPQDPHRRARRRPQRRRQGPGSGCRRRQSACS